MEIGKKHILIVDPDEFLVRVYAAKLNRAGYLTDVATSVDEAVEIIDKNKPDLIIYEPKMIDGLRFDFIENIKKTESIKILIVSMISEPEKIKKAEEAGSDKYFIKTQNSFDSVIKTINNLLEK